MIKTIVTHDGKFHADEVFAIALWELMNPTDGFIIMRTRDQSIIAAADIIIDVGGVYSPKYFEFDHHLTEIPLHTNGIKMASFGMVAKHFGMSETFMNKFVYGIDSTDNGSDTTFPNMGLWVAAMNPTWDSDINPHDSFTQCVDIARGIIDGQLRQEAASNKAEKYIAEALEKRADHRLLVLEVGLPWKSYIGELHPEVQFVLLPSFKEGNWNLQAVNVGPGTMELKVQIPDWVSSESGVVFRHHSGHLAVFNNYKDAFIIAKMILK